MSENLVDQQISENEIADIEGVENKIKTKRNVQSEVDDVRSFKIICLKIIKNSRQLTDLYSIVSNLDSMLGQVEILPLFFFHFQHHSRPQHQSG